MTGKENETVSERLISRFSETFSFDADGVLVDKKYEWAPVEKTDAEKHEGR